MISEAISDVGRTASVASSSSSRRGGPYSSMLGAGPRGEVPGVGLVLGDVARGPREVAADEDPEALALAVVAHDPRHVRGAVLAGLGGKVAEGAKQPAPAPPLQLGISVDDLAQPRVQVDT